MSLENSPMVASSQLARDQRKVHRISRGAERRFQRAGKEGCASSDGDARHRRADEDLESESRRRKRRAWNLFESANPGFCTSAAKGHGPEPKLPSGNLLWRHTRAAHAKVNAIPNFRH